MTLDREGRGAVGAPCRGSTPREIFARNLQRHRRAAGMSQERLAFRARLHRTEISLLERGGRDPRLTTIARLAYALGIPAQALVESVEEGSREPAGGD